MENFSNDLLIALLGMHVIALVIAIYMYRDAPCWIQKLCMVLLALSFTACCAAYIAALVGTSYWWGFLLVAAAFEHTAVLLYVFRLWWQGEQRKWIYLINSQNSPK